MTPEEKWRRARVLLNEMIWRKCAMDPAFFISNYCWIRKPPDGHIQIKMRDVQEEILQIWHTNRMTISLKARQIGWTTIAALYSLWLTMFHPGKNVIILSRGQEFARDSLSIAVIAYERLPQFMQDGAPMKQQTLEKVGFANGSMIQSLPSKKDPARGKTADVVFADEFAFWDDPDNQLPALMPVVDIGGSLHFLSSANGSGTAFERMYVRAKKGQGRFKSMFYGWRCVPERDDAWYAGQMEELEEWQLHQEYPGDDVEAFIRSGNPVFNQESLKTLIEAAVEPELGEVMEYLGGYNFMSLGAGDLEVFQEPIEGESYVIGGDTSRGLESGDFASASVLRLSPPGEPMVHVASLHGRIEPDVFGFRLMELGYFYNTAFIGVESNNHGISTLIAMRDGKYPGMFYRRVVGKKKDKRTKEMGWHTDRRSKPLMMDELGRVIRKGDLHMMCAETLAEMRSYRRLRDGSMAGAPHDDRVISMAIACQMAIHAPKRFRPQQLDSGPEPFSMQWALDLVQKKDPKPATSFLEARRNG